jgi:hypothetical protein
VRNRYYESGSGEEEVEQPLINSENEDREDINQEIENFQVEFQDQLQRPSTQNDPTL